MKFDLINFNSEVVRNIDHLAQSFILSIQGLLLLVSLVDFCLELCNLARFCVFLNSELFNMRNNVPRLPLHLCTRKLSDIDLQTSIQAL